MADAGLTGPARDASAPTRRQIYEARVRQRSLRIAAGSTLAVILAIVAWFVLARTMKGFEIAVLGSSARAGRFAGFSAKRMTIFAFCISGAMAGLAGIAEVSGTVGKLDDKLSLGYGFSAIIVAFLGRLNPLGCLAAAFVLALTYIGGENAQIAMGISDRATRVFQGLLLFFVLASDTLIQYQIRVVRPKPDKPSQTHQPHSGPIQGRGSGSPQGKVIASAGQTEMNA